MEPPYSGLISYYLRRTQDNNKGCKVWMGGTNTHGYGDVYHMGKRWALHRLIYKLHYGEFDTSLMVLHSCDNPPCINIEHLRLGTSSDNMQDAIARNRRPSQVGEGNHCVKLNEVAIKVIRYIYSKRRKTAKQIAKAYRVSHQTIGDITRRKSWKHV